MQWTTDRLGDPGRGSDSYLGSLGTNALEKPGLKSSLKNLSRLKKQVTAPRTTTVVAHSQPCGSLLTATRQLRCYKGKLTAQKGPCRLLAFSVSSDFPPSTPTTPQALLSSFCSSNVGAFSGFHRYRSVRADGTAAGCVCCCSLPQSVHHSDPWDGLS